MSIQTIIIQIFALLFAITVHEAAHGWAALKLGDPTAYSLGRVTLNPIAHIDLMGTILLPAMLILMGAHPFGWAKPVPVNPMNLRNPRRDNLIISAAGPLANLALALGAFVIIQIIKAASPALLFRVSGLFLILYSILIINIILAIFNMIPLPPLDGSGVLLGFLSPEAAQKYEQITPYSFFIIMILVMTGIIGRIFGVFVGIVNSFLF